MVASTASAEDCGSGGGVAVKHGTAGKGPVIGLVQVCTVRDDMVAMHRRDHAREKRKHLFLWRRLDYEFALRYRPHLRE